MKIKRILKKIGIAFGILIILLVVTGFFCYRYFSNTFLKFEDDYPEVTQFETLSEDGYTYLDRNRNGRLDLYEDHRQPIKRRVADVLSQMTLEEKIHLLKGSGIASAIGQVDSETAIPGAVGTIVPTPRLGLPTIYLSDGPAGLRIQPTRKGEDRTYYCTAFPIATNVASTWNQELANEIGAAMGTEAKEYGIDVILGPGANIHRHPLCGRNFEYFSEDPVVTGLMSAALVNGIEQQGIGTALKHYVANNQETERTFNDVLVSERAMREIYLKGFELNVRYAQPWTIMSSYNKVNGVYTSESPYLLTDVLRGDWSFEGLVMTDWFGGRDAVAQIEAGNDLLEPGTKRQWDALSEGAEDGSLTLEAIDRSAGRILTVVFNSQKMKGYQPGNDPDLEAHAQITRQSAAEGIILLKNEGVLPLDTNMNVALLGVTSYEFISGGTGSGDVNEAYTISLEEGLRNAGFRINDSAKQLFEEHKAQHLESFKKVEGMDAMFTPYQPQPIAYTASQLDEIAASTDVGILTIGRNAGEGGDRTVVGDFLLTQDEQRQLALIKERFMAAGRKFIVVLNVGGVIETASWNELPDAILLAWQGGQEGGNSVADIVSGAQTPSGKLPMTFPIDIADHASDANFPAGGDSHFTPLGLMSAMVFPPDPRPEEQWEANRDYTVYDEGIYVGYRHFDKAGLKVAYPFGYGLSYTTFEYSVFEAHLEGDEVILELTVSNTGTYPGKEVVQVYAEKLQSKIDRPLRELKAFAKTAYLLPGESQTLNLQFPVSELRYWDEQAGRWSLEMGTYQIHAAASSRDLRVQVQLDL